jgi:peroxiredoxin
MATEAPVKQGAMKLIPFALKDTDEKVRSLDEIRGKSGTLIMFLCNHCPYVKAVIGRLVEDAKAIAAAGVGIAAIMPNDTEAYPADSFENMQRFTKEHALPFPYLIDDTQEIARAYGAVCTPDLFGFNAGGELQYRGRVDSAGSKPPTGTEKRELREAMLQIARTGKGPAEQIPSIGCSIKWRL